MQVIIPTVTTQGGFTRASSASYFDSAGVLQTVGVDVLRIGYNPLSLTDPPAAIVEAAATNIILNSATLATQTVTVAAAAYTLSFYGTGTVTLSGALVDSVVGTGVSPKRRIYTFAPTAGSLTLTVTGSCTNAQLELGSAASSYIATTASSVTRAADVVVNGLVYSNIPETDFPLWSSTTTYAVGANVILANHRKYTSLRASNLNFNPATDTTAQPYWLDIGPTNQYAMFDGKVGTQTSATQNITVVVSNGIINGLSFMEMDAAQAQVTLSSNGAIVYSQTIDLTAPITDWSQYFVSPITRASDYVLTDVPIYLSGVLTVVITAPTGTVKCGNLVVGSLFDLGITQQSPTVGIIDYSTKTIDSFGNPTLIVKAYSKRMNAKMILEGTAVDGIAKKLASIRATPCVWIGAGNSFQSLIIYGYYKDFEVDIAYAMTAYCTLTIEGLT